MKVSDLLTKLSFNELANLSLSGEGSGDIDQTQYARFIDKTNNALLDLHTRFILSEKLLVLRTYDWKSMYPLRQKYALSSDSNEQYKYIVDTPNDPFIGDVINILNVTNEVGNSLPINDDEQYASVFTPQVDTLQITHPGCDQVFIVAYRAKHPELTFDNGHIDVSLAQDIEVPVALEAALRYRIAQGIFGAMSGQDYSNQTQAMEKAYETECLNIEDKSLLGYKSIVTNVKLERRGFK